MTRPERSTLRQRRSPRRAAWLALALLALAGCGPSGPGNGDGRLQASFVVAYAGTEVTFDARGSTGAGPLDFQWTFGDGASASGAVATHRYTDPGRFTARLTVTDGAGATDAASR